MHPETLGCRAESQGRGQVIKGMTARQVVRLLLVCGVGNGECRGQVLVNAKDEREGKPVARQLAPMISKFISGSQREWKT